MIFSWIRILSGQFSRGITLREERSCKTPNVNKAIFLPLNVEFGSTIKLRKAPMRKAFEREWKMASLRLFLAFLRFRSSVRSSLKPECVKDYDKLSEGMRRPAGSLCICSSFSLPFFQNSVFPPAVKLRRSMNDRISVGVAKNGSFSWNNLPVIDFKSTVKFIITLVAASL